jgi:uncharacterized protein YggT (Ycf19 family)
MHTPVKGQDGRVMEPLNEASMLRLEKVARAIVYFVYFFVVAAVVILALAFFLLLFGANPQAPFAEWTYRSMDRVMAPFRGLFQPIRLDGRSVFDTSVLFAIVVYSILGVGLRALIDWLTYRIELTETRRYALRAGDPAWTQPVPAPGATASSQNAGPARTAPPVPPAT